MPKHLKTRKNKHMSQSSRHQTHEPTLHEKTIPIKGMHCASCELLIADELQSLAGVEHATASLKTNSATIKSVGRVSDYAIEKAVKAAGYEVGIDDGTKPLITRNVRVWRDFLYGIALVGLLAVFFSLFGLGNIVNSTSTSEGTGTMALIIGLTAGFSTCMALIGGLVLSVAAKYAENHPTETPLQKFRPHLLFNAGRILSFIVLGAVIGWIGSAFALKGSLLGLLTIVVGFVMLVLGLQLTELFPRITKGFTLPSGVAKFFGIKQRNQREYSHKNAFFLGGVTFFLPCGFTQAMQLLAVSTGSPLQGAIIMGAFAIGTAPGLLSLGGLTSIVSGAFAQRFFRVVGVVVVAMALINFSNGYTLMGLGRFVDKIMPNFSNSSQSSKEEASASTADSTVLNTTYTLRGDISPSTFTAKVGQKTTLLVDVKDNGQGCMSTIMIIGLDDSPQYLRKGKQLALTFTATEPGRYTIACAMGIPRGTITVTQ